MTPPKVLKTLNLIKIGALWVWKNLWGYGRKVHATFWPWGTPWDPSYFIFVFSVRAQIPNIEYFEVYGGLHALGGISSFFSLSFPSNGVRSCLGTDFCPEL